VGPNLWTANELATSLMCANLPCVLPVIFRCNAGIRTLWSSWTGSKATSATEISDSYPPPSKSTRVQENIRTSNTGSESPSTQLYGLPREKTATIKADVKGGNQFDSLPDQETGTAHGGIGVEQEVKWNEDEKKSMSS
jgi:hypothetical protein